MPIYKVKAPDGSIMRFEGPENATPEQVVAAAKAQFESMQTAAAAESMQEQATAATDMPQYGARPDGTQKGQGFLGAISLPTGGVATEYTTQSDAVTVNGQRIDFPTLVPTLTQQEVELMRSDIIPNQKPIPESVMQKAIQHANSRLASGLPVFADQAEPDPQRPPEQGMGQRMLEQILLPADIGVSALSSIPGIAVYGGQAFAGLIDSIRRGTYGTRVGGQQMAQRAMEGLQQTIIQPRTQMGQQVMQAAADVAEELKLAPVPVTAGLYAPAARAVARPEGAAATIAEAERLGVPVLTSDVRPPRTFIGKTAQRTGERVPIAGTGPVRAEQQQARADAVRSVLSDYGAVDVSDLSDSIVADLAARRSGQLSKYTQNKTEVIERLSGQGTVPVPRALQAIDDQIADLTRRRTAGADEAIVRLQEIRSDLQNRDLFQLEAYRKDELAKVFMDDPARPMSVAARDAGEKALRAIYDPVRKDMGQFIRDNGERKDFDKWSIANKRLSELSDELDVSAFKSVLKLGKATPEVVNQLLLNKKPSSVRLLYNSLTPEGRSIVRTSLLSQIAQKAEIELPDRTKTYSPDRFNSELKKIQPQIDIFFRGDDRKRVEGLSRVLQLTRRAGEAGVSTQTGQETFLFVSGTFLTDLLGTAGASLATAGGIGSVARIYESAPVRNRLLRIQATKPGSPQELKLRDEILLELKKAAQNELAATGAAVAPTVLSAQQPEEQK